MSTLLTPWFMNVLGLCIGVIAAVLMYYFPPRVIAYTENGAQVFTWTNEPTPEGKQHAAWQTRVSRAAPWLLALGFVLQLLAALLTSPLANAG
jgi:hypothetical protein